MHWAIPRHEEMPSDNLDRDIERQPRDITQAERSSGIHEEMPGNSQPHAEVDKVEERIIMFSTGLAGIVLIFTALFSGIIATFLSISLPDLKNQTTSLTPSLVVNILWLLSLTISLSSALNATLFQVYQGTSQLSQPRRRGIVLTFVKKFTMAQAVGLSVMPTLLIISFISFFGGLIVYVWNIHTAAGYCVLIFLLIFTYASGWPEGTNAEKVAKSFGMRELE
ncbi:hypothetical protein EI94DRAFT_1788251 [Lactarius quietus]|nr:hypothetical protein EI94DRAFT_1788251 [Lactarius quietus]